MPDISEIYGGFDLSDPKAHADYLDDDNKCCGTAMGVWLIICNVILLILGVAALGIGAWVQSQPGFAWTAGSVGVGLIILGVFLAFVALLGCIAAKWKKRCLMAIYAFLLFIFFIAELAALVVSAAATNVAVTGLIEGWNLLSDENKDGVGMYFGCCSSTDTAKYGVDGDGTSKTTCLATDTHLTNGESTKGNPASHTMATGECTIFGMDYKGDDGKVDQVSFPQYKTSFTTDTTCVLDPVLNEVEPADKKCATMNKDKTGCIALKNDADKIYCKFNDAKGAACKKAAGGKSMTVPPECLCKMRDDKSPEPACRQLKAVIPSCSSKAAAVFPFVVGLDNLPANESGEMPAPMAACYSKFETWISDNMMTCIIITAFVFVYQLLQLVFSFALCCGCCNSKKSDDDIDRASGI